MPTAKKSRPKHRRIVLKFGSGTLTGTRNPGLDLKQFARISAEVAGLIQRGYQCVTVTSGAVAAGTSVLALSERPQDLATAQASAAVGQSKLMHAYERAFGRYKLNVAQLLLTHSDLDSRTRRANAGNTLERLLTAGNVVPIINENDSVATEELTFGDNDRLSAEVATLARADLLIILTQVDGLLDPDGKVIPLVRDIDRGKEAGEWRTRPIFPWGDGLQAGSGQDGGRRRDHDRDNEWPAAGTDSRCHRRETGRDPLSAQHTISLGRWN